MGEDGIFKQTQKPSASMTGLVVVLGICPSVSKTQQNSFENTIQQSQHSGLETAIEILQNSCAGSIQKPQRKRLAKTPERQKAIDAVDVPALRERTRAKLKQPHYTPIWPRGVPVNQRMYDTFSDAVNDPKIPPEMAALFEADAMEYTNIMQHFTGTNFEPHSGEICDCVPVYEPHSGLTDDKSIMKVVNNETHQNVHFADNDDPFLYAMKGQYDKTRSLQDTGGDDLGSFFSRPIKISETEWNTNTSLNVVIDPWMEFINNPRVANRMTNYNLMRAKLRVKVLINGNSFLYGRAMALYHPMHLRDDFTNLGSTTSLVQGSQMPHVFLDPTTSTGGELCLPFFYERNNVNLPSGDYAQLGRMHIISLNDLLHSNGATVKATISVFAWMENVELNMLTSLDMPLTPQSGEEVDEANLKGIVSGPATAISKTAANLSETPVIGPYAMATSLVAGVTAQIAKLYGYSRPATTKDPEPYKPVTVSSLATTTVPDGAAKLTVDDKQELTIDPTISGIGPGDPLNIHQIAKRESYLTSFDWAVGEAPESLLWNTRVAPTLWALDDDGESIYLPACAMAALPFKYWTGTIKLRFQVVASAFHKGRLKFVYDPNFMSSNEYNTNFMEIVDIAEKQDFTIELGVGQDRSLLTSPIPNGNPIVHYGGIPLGPSGLGNGVLSAFIVNELTTPDTTAPRDISVNVFISAGDDFEVFVPDKRFQSYEFKPQSGVEPEPVSQMQSSDSITYVGASWRLSNCNSNLLDCGYDPQSGVEMQVNDALVSHEPSPPQQSDSDILGAGISNDEDLNKVFIGEAIKSFRPLLKRYSLHSMLNACFNGSRQVLYGRRTAFPYYRGEVANAVNLTDLAVPFNYCNTLLLHWVTLAFAGYRGAMRWKFVLQGEISDSASMNCQVERSISTSHYQNGRTSVFAPTTESQMAFQGALNPSLTIPEVSRPLGGTQGMAVTNSMVNPNTEFEVPYYSQDRFIPGKLESYTTPTLGRELNVFDYRIFIDGQPETYVNAFTAVGEDFQVYFFTGLPPVYYNPSVPSPEAS